MSKIPLFVSSATVAAKSALGSTITIDGNPFDTRGKSIRVLSSAIWYVFPNVTDAYQNTTIKFVYNSLTHTIELQKGLYAIDDIEETIKEYCENFGLLPSDLISLIADEATNKITLKIKTSLLFSMDFEDADNKLFKEYLGFTGNISCSSLKNFDGTNIATLNVNNSIYIHCSFANGAYYNGNSGSNVIAVAHINVAPSKLMITADANPSESSCVSGNISRYQLWLTNERGQLLDMNGEDWSVALEIF